MRIKGMNSRNDFAVTGVYVKVINLLLAGTFRGSGSGVESPRRLVLVVFLYSHIENWEFAKR